ncbi:hypothetical protein [Yokenella regensburgei]|uniref:hypothetical protein n=1 Tax=Yokenella regensburgei TaxID=158877 RepID=UPI0013761B4C|nr:hypothetical protein [Yokenella regensburgei]KAF1366257.1 hypothetical protein FHR25_005290 [Yokenella regensburgei]
MTFDEIRESMTDEACDIISAFVQETPLTLQAIVFITGQREHATRFILEQMAAGDVVIENNGLWCLTEGFNASIRSAKA